MSEKDLRIKELTDMVADFIGHIGKKLPDDVKDRLAEVGSKEKEGIFSKNKR